MSTTSVRVLSVAHALTDARLGRIVRGLVEQSEAHVTLEGLGGGTGGPDAVERLDLVERVELVARPPAGALGRAVRAVVLPFLGSHDVLLVVDPDLVPAAWLATRLRRSALVVDVHEDYDAVARDRPWARGVVGALARVVVRFVLALAARAELTTVADEHVPPLDARRRLVVRNRPVLGTLPDAGEPGPTPRAVYIGDLRPSRGLHTMIEAVAGTDDWELDLVGAVAEVDLDALRASLRERGIADRVRLHGRLPPDEAWRVARGAWVGLCLLESTPAYVAAMPTKVLEYLAVGLPVLATPLPRVRSLLDDAGAGCCVGGVHEAVSTLRDWSTHPDRVVLLRSRARAWADHHLAGPSPFDEMAAAILSLPQDDTAP